MDTLPNKPNNSNTLPGAAGEIETFAMANCVMLLTSQQNAAANATVNGGDEEFGRIYPCKTCGKKFPSFQALGGHRASHKKSKLASEVSVSGEVLDLPVKKAHVCNFCGLQFSIGQALGGHMRRHRGLIAGGGKGGSGGGSTVTTEGSSGNSSDGGGYNSGEKRMVFNGGDDDVIVKKSSNSKRVCLDLDLNLKLCLNSEEEDDDDEVTVVNGGGDDGDDGVDRKVDEVHEVEEGEIVEDDFLELRLGSYYYR